MSNAMNDAKHVQQYVLKMRKYFHQNPELSGMEEKTSLKIIAELKQMKVEYEMVGNYSIIAFVNRGKGYKSIAFKANMDALPITESGDYNYKSKVANTSHMSGHDIDMAILLGVIKTLKRKEKELSGEIVFIFEANNLSFDGAREIMNSAILKNIDYIFSIHDFPVKPTGSLVINEGLFLIGADTLNIKWYGEFAPSPFSYEAKDPIMAAANFTSNIRSFISSNINPWDIATVTVTEFMSGGFHNIIADYCEMTLNIRYQNEEVRRRIHQLIIDYTKSIERQFKVTSKISVKSSVKPVINDSEAYHIAYNSAEKIVDSDKIMNQETILNCEPFSCYLDKYKGAFLVFGSKNNNTENNSRGFTNTYNPNEDAFQYASAWCIQIALDYLKKK